MKKKIVERPRFKDRSILDANRRIRRSVKAADPDRLDRLPIRESKRRPHILRWHGKSLNENLNPLFRYLNKQAGRKWDDVYSEICEQIRPDSATQLHILQHLGDIVVTRVVVIDGVACYGRTNGWYRGSGHRPIEGFRRGSYKTMYVDPRDGILKIAPDKVYATRGRTGGTRDDAIWDEKNPLRQFRRIKGIWYEIEFRELGQEDLIAFDEDGRKLPRYEWRSRTRDIVLGQESASVRDIERAYGRLLVPISKRQMNKRQIKRLLEMTASLT